MSATTRQAKPCQSCQRRTERPQGLCWECEPNKPKARRPARSCDVCGWPTTAKSGTCRTCTRPRKGRPSEKHALRGGDWVNVKGVQRWVPRGQVA